MALLIIVDSLLLNSFKWLTGLHSGRDYTYRGNRVINNRFRHIRSLAGDDTQAV